MNRTRFLIGFHGGGGVTWREVCACGTGVVFATRKSVRPSIAGSDTCWTVMVRASNIGIGASWSEVFLV